MATVLEKIFSIKDYGDTHKQLRFLGIKLKIPKREFANQRKNSVFYYYKNNNLDITTFPPAEGGLRKIQLANLALLKELDYVCKQNGLTYWLDFGTALGAVRHKGFIPWDDDIDIGMPREDYDKIIDAFNKSSRNPDIYADYWKSKKNPCQYYIRIYHKKCKHLFVDIFPYDKYGEILSNDERLKMSDKIRTIRKKMHSECEKIKADAEYIKMVINRERKKLLKNSNASSDFVWGLDFNHGWKNWFYSYDTIFPLREIEYEGVVFPCMNQAEKFLSEVYGNYMDYPKKISISHTSSKLSHEDEKIIEDLIKEI